MKALKITGWAIAGIAFFAGAMALVSLILSALWNWLMPVLFNLPEISFWQAAGIFILTKLLFTPGFGHNREPHDTHKKKAWKSKFMSRMKHPQPHVEVEDVPYKTHKEE